MAIYQSLSIVALCVEALLLGFFIFMTVKSKKAFSKKTGWYFIPVFALVYLLYVMGYLYTNKEPSALMMLKLFCNTVETFIFKIEISVISTLAKDCAVYYAATIIGAIFAGATLIASAIGLFGERLKNQIKVARLMRSGKECVIGDNENALEYAKNNNAIVMCMGGTEKIKDLVSQNYNVLPSDFSKKKVYGKVNFKKGGMYHFVVFADSGYAYSQIIDWFIAAFDGIKKACFTLHIEASLSELDIINRRYIDISKNSHLSIKAFNKYELLARKFIEDNPMSLDIPDSFYGEHRTIKKDKNINVVHIGFGKVNYELMQLMIMQNQFVGLSADGTKFENHPVNYYVYDSSDDTLHSQLLMRLENMEKFDGDLPAPEKICNLKTVGRKNVHSNEFIDELKKIIGGENSYTYIVVSIGSDYENMDYAENLDMALGNQDNIKIFTRVKHSKTLGSNIGKITCFGYEKDIICSDVIINRPLEKLEKLIHGEYTASKIEKENAKLEQEAQKKLSDSELKFRTQMKNIASYNELDTIEKYSNEYNAISIFFKLGLLGFRLVKTIKGETCDKSQKDLITNIYGAYSRDEKDYNRYFELNPWSMLAFSEHSRWVALYILKGFRQMKTSEIYPQYDDNGKFKKFLGKNIPARKHCCITSYLGLDTYHRTMLDKYLKKGINKTLSDIETYKYDYMLMPDGYTYLFDEGYKIVKKDETPDPPKSE